MDVAVAPVNMSPDIVLDQLCLLRRDPAVDFDHVRSMTIVVDDIDRETDAVGGVEPMIEREASQAVALTGPRKRCHPQ